MSFKPTKWTLVVVLCAAMPSLLGTAAVAPVLDLMKDAFDAPEFVINLVLTLPPVATAAAGFVIGSLSDKIGRVRILSLSLLLFGLAGVSGFFLENVYAIIGFRLLLGVSIAGLIPMVSALISEYYEGAERTRYLGYQAVSIGFGTLILQTCCGALAGLGWHYSFLIYLLGLAVLPFVLIFVKEPDRTHRNSDAASGPAKRAPLLSYVFIYFAMFCMALLMYIPAVNLSYYLGGFAEPVPPFQTGLILGLFGLFSAVSGLVFRRAAKLFSYRHMFAVIFGIEALGIFLAAATQNIVLVTAGFALLGFGIGFGIPNASLRVSRITPPAVLGKYMSGVTVSLFAGLFATTFAGPIILLAVGDGNYAGLLMLTAAFGVVLSVIFFAVGIIKKQPPTSSPE